MNSDFVINIITRLREYFCVVSAITSTHWGDNNSPSLAYDRKIICFYKAKYEKVLENVGEIISPHVNVISFYQLNITVMWFDTLRHSIAKEKYCTSWTRWFKLIRSIKRPTSMNHTQTTIEFPYEWHTSIEYLHTLTQPVREENESDDQSIGWSRISNKKNIDSVILLFSYPIQITIQIQLGMMMELTLWSHELN